MLQKSKSKTVAKVKYLALMPLMLVMLTYVACSDENSSINSTEEDSLSQYGYTINVDERINDDNRKVHRKYEEFLTNNPGYVSWATIYGNSISYSVHNIDEEIPEGYTKLRIKDKYNMYINLPNSENNKGINRVMKIDETGKVVTQFRIDETGKVVDVRGRAPHPKLKAEAKRVSSEYQNALKN